MSRGIRRALGPAAFGAGLAALPALAAEGGAIRGGEHDGFTRIVLEIEPTTEWSLETADGLANLRFPGRPIDFSTAGTFDKIPRTRIRSVETANDGDGTIVSVALGCDCRVSTSFVGARFLALDIADRAPLPPGTPEDDAPRQARELHGARLVSEAEDALVRQIERAADQGIVRFSEAEPEGTAANATDEAPASRPLPRPAAALAPVALKHPAAEPMTIADLARQEQISATSVFDLDSRQAAKHPAVKPVPGACLDDKPLDLAAWSDGTPFAGQIARLRRRLVGEFDTPDPDAVRATARVYIRFGLGTEAEATLAAFPAVPLPDRALLLDLSRAVEGRPLAAGGPLSVDMACPGLHGLWQAVGGGVPVWRDAASFAAVQASFAELPTDLRALLAPDLVRRLIEAGRTPEARLVYLTAVRPGESPGPALQLTEARLEAAEGRASEAVRTMARLAHGREASISLDALTALVRVALQAHLAIPEPVATDLATAALQYRGSPRDAELRSLLAETLAGRGDLPGALAELRQAMTDLRPDAGRFAALAVRLVAEADPMAIGPAVYAETALGVQDLIDARPPTDPVRAAIADRLVTLGLPDPALAIVAPALAAGDEGARLAAARAEIARGDGAAARAALGPLASTAAVELRAQAFARSGAYDEALATLEAAGLGDSAAAYAWASGDWPKARAAAGGDADRATMADYMATRAGEAPAAAPAADPEALAPDAAFVAPLPSLDRPSLGAARQLLATGGKVGGFVADTIAKP